MNRIFAASAVLASVAAIGTPSTADPHYGPQTRAIAVAYSDLDLSSEVGAQSMLKRLTAAAGRACGGRPEQGGVALLTQIDTWNACRAEALREAVAKLGQPVVSRVHAASTFKTVKVAGH